MNDHTQTQPISEDKAIIELIQELKARIQVLEEDSQDSETRLEIIEDRVFSDVTGEPEDG